MNRATHLRVLGAVLAGGRSSRFGSDKALASVGGQTLLQRAVALLESQCDSVVVVGRDLAPAPTVPDHPRADMGPLGGIAGALRHAAAQGFDQVLTVPVDGFGPAPALLAELVPAPACCDSQPVIGLWPVSALPALEQLLASDARHSVRAFAARIGARTVALSRLPANINTPADLAAIEDACHGL